MSGFRTFLSRLLGLFGGSRRDRELCAEIDAHIKEAIAEHVRQGMTSDKARRAALREFGGVTQTIEALREQLRFPLLSTLRQDLHYAVRTLTRAPAFAIVAVLTLGLGIGANTAIFSIVNAVLLRPLPYKDSDQLVRVLQQNPNAMEVTERRSAAINQEHFLPWRARTQTLSHLAAFERQPMLLGGRAEPVRLPGARVSAAMFPMLGVDPEIGHGFDDADERPGGRTVVVLSHEMWQRYFSLDPGIVGRTIPLDGRAHIVAGVMPASFGFPDKETLFWTPFVFTPPVVMPNGGEVIMVQAIGRLKDGVSLERAAAEASTFRAIAETPGRIELVRLKDELVAPFRPALTTLLASVGFVLLIACANVANLLLSRAASRRQEMVVRSLLGASRARLIRQVLHESLLLAALGGGAGVLFAYWGTPIVAALDPGTIPRLNETRLDAPVLLFSVGISLVTAVFFGLAPALHVSRPNPTTTFRGTRVRSLFTAAEVALAMILLVGAGVLIRGFIKVSNASRGFNPENVLTFELALPEARYSAARRMQLGEEFLQDLRAEPGVVAASLSDTLPSQPARMAWWQMRRGPGAGPPAGWVKVGTVDIRIISTEFFKAAGMTLVAGRTFDDGDRAGRPLVLLINKAMARYRFGSENPIGRTLPRGALNGAETPWTVIGVVEDVKPAGVDARIQPEIYIDFRQAPLQLSEMTMVFTLRTASDTAAVVARARTHLKRHDPQVILGNVATMTERMSDSVAQPRFYTVMLGAFAFVALALAAVGLYGVMSYAVSQRTKEIGIRMALGAGSGHVIGLVAGQSMIVTTAGIGVGLAGAFAVTRYLESMLFGLSPFDAPTVGAVTLLLATVAALASYIPARRATRVDPMVALRTE
jgi:putative ABC transport system permease protein